MPLSEEALQREQIRVLNNRVEYLENQVDEMVSILRGIAEHLGEHFEIFKDQDKINHAINTTIQKLQEG
jgi:hypothetical protein